MRKLSGAFFLFLLLAAPVRADWEIASATTESSAAGVQHRHVVLQNRLTDATATIDLALFASARCTLRVIDQPNEPRADLAAVMHREHCLAGVNGGYFDPADKPVGLLIAEGKVIAPLRKARLLTGVAMVANGRLQLLRFAEYSSRRNATAAIQCGPFLVDRGQTVSGLEDTRSARRSFILAAADRSAIGFCSDVTLLQLGKILAVAGLAPELKVQRALNLDGGSSSAFWFEGERGPLSISEQKTVRDFVAVVPK